MIDSKGGAFGFDCCLASPKFRVFQQPARGHRLEAARLALPLGPVARLVEDENPTAPAVKREAEEDWGKDRWR
jgi:hypothetical protein